MAELYQVPERPFKGEKIRVIKLPTLAAATDTVALDPADTAKNVYVKGMKVSEGTATNLTWKQRSQAKTGTVATTSSSATITGTGTDFDGEYAVGDEIVITDGDTLEIQSIASDTSMTATANASTTVSGKAHKRQETIITEELAANQGVYSKVMPGGWDLATENGYALVLNPTVQITDLLLHLQIADGDGP